MHGARATQSHPHPNFVPVEIEIVADDPEEGSIGRRIDSLAMPVDHQDVGTHATDSEVVAGALDGATQIRTSRRILRRGLVVGDAGAPYFSPRRGRQDLDLDRGATTASGG